MLLALTGMVAAPAHAAVSLIATVPLGAGCQPHGVLVNARTGRIYVACTGGGAGTTVRVVDATTHALTGTIAVGSEPFGLALNPATQRLYAANRASDSVSVIDADPASASFHTVLATIAVGDGPQQLGANPQTNRIYVSNTFGSTLSVIDGATNAVITSIPMPASPDGVAVDTVANRVYVASFGANQVSIVDGGTNTIVDSIFPLSTPTGLALDPLTNRLWVTLLGANVVRVIDTATNATLATVATGANPYGVALSIFGNRAYVAASAAASLEAIDAVQNGVIQAVPIGASPREVAFNPETRRVYVANNLSDDLSVLDDPTECCNLQVSVPSGMPTVTGAGRFELRFNPAAGGGIDEFFDLAADPGRTQDLAGGSPDWNSFPTLFLDRMWYELFPGPTGGFAVSSGDGFVDASRAHLLEATATRARVRQDTIYQSDGVQGGGFRIAALKGLGDYSVYGPGRLALRWERRAYGSVPWGGGVGSLGAADLNWVVHKDPAVPALNAWSGYRPAGALPPNTTGGAGSGADDFLLVRGDHTATSPNVTTDFLVTLYQDWSEAQVTAQRDTSAGPDKAARLAWEDDRTGPAGPHIRSWLAGDGDSFDFLASFRPGSLVDHLDSAVVQRAADYRNPAPVAMIQGTRWADADENTGGAADFFNEAEAAYVFDADNPGGLAFDLSGSLASPVFKPFFKIRQWRSLLRPAYVGLEGRALRQDVDYSADVKPVSRAHFVVRLSWHCTFESTTACDPGTLDVGSTGDASLVGAILPGRYGSAADFTSQLDVATAGTPGSDDFSPSAGAVEFWYQPHYENDDGLRYLLWYNQSGSAPDFHCMWFEKTTGNQLRLLVRSNFADAACATSDGNSVTQSLTASAFAYTGWRVDDWVHLRTTWNVAGGARKLRIFVNGVEVAFSGTLTPMPSHGATAFGGCAGAACPGGAGSANGLIDEAHIYTGIDATTNEPDRPIAFAGLLADPSEHLADPVRNFTLDLLPVDASYRGRYLLVGADAKFHGLNVDLAVPGTGANPGGLKWEYWDGTRWVSREGGGFTDTTNSLLQSGEVSWLVDPVPWRPYSIGGGPDLYYVRVSLEGAPYATPPAERRIGTDILLVQYCGDVTAAAQTFAFPEPGTADLAIAKTDGAATAVPGAAVGYTITVTNNGPDTVTGLFVNDAVPATILSPVFTPSSGSYDAGTGEWTGLTLAATQSVTLTLAGTIDPAARGTLTNTATVSPPLGITDPNSANDAAGDTDTLTPAVDVSISKADAPDPAQVGGLLTYTLTVTNAGPSSASGVSVSDPLPATMALDGAPAGAIVPSQGACSYDFPTHTVSCVLGGLQPAQSATVTIKVRPGSVGAFTNTASVTRAEPDTAAANDSDAETTTVEVSSLGVRFLTATSSSQRNVLEWVNPADADYVTTEIMVRTDAFPTGPGDPLATSLYNANGGGSGGRMKLVHGLPAPPLTNGQTYFYGAFVHRAVVPLVSPGRFVTGRPFDHTAGPVKWAFSTGATALAPPTVGGAGVIATSNDRGVYAMQRGIDADFFGIDSGEWPAAWRPIELGGPVQHRSPVIPLPVGASNPVAYLGAQDGRIYVVDAAQGGSVGFPWPPALIGPMVQAAPAGIFPGFGGSRSYLLVGTRDGSGPNAFVALDPQTGAVVDSWNNGGAGAGAIGVVSGMAAVDYGPPPRVYFTSRAGQPVGSTNTVWCFDLPAAAPIFSASLAWVRQLGDIDASPTLRGTRVFVGSPQAGGTVLSLDSASGGDDRGFLHADGQVKGFVFPDRDSGDLFFATDNSVWAVTDTGAALVNKFAGPISLPGGAKPSPVLFARGTGFVYVGGSDGKLYEIDVAPAVPTIKSVTLGNGLSVVGAPSLDIGFSPNLVLVGTEAGIFYAVQVPLP